VKIKINGEFQEFAEDKIMLMDYLKSKSIKPQTVAIEYNRDIVAKKNYDTMQMKDGDELEIVRFVSGG